ncbi:hypothetical protein L7F22_008465 [Adiantum nelumboides]|nr:hypothetical protein [Adiantum nelumboides]
MVMNSLANLNSVVADEQGDSTPWPSDQGWDPPVATICTGSLSDHTRLHFHHSTAAAPRQEWDWSDSQMLLAPHYVAEDDDLECKPGILHVDTLAGSGLGLRQYSTGLMSAAASMVPPSLAAGGSGNGTVQTTSWPGLLNAVPLRQQIGLESSGGSCYSSSPLMYGGSLGAHEGSNTGQLAGSYYNNTHQNQMLEMEQRRIHDILRRGIYSTAGDLGSGRLGLNLGGRTYFSTEDIGARFHLSGAGKRFRPNSPSMHVPLCQAEGCKADLSIAKHYHRRHKVCEYHSKAATVIITGNTQRFCQQCSRFHALTEFDEGKRSCRKRLADHNRRRRKPQPVPAPDSATPTTEAAISSNDTLASKQNEEQPQDSKPGTSFPSRSQSDQQGGQNSKEGMTGNMTASSSSTEQQTSLLSPMTLAPSVSLTLQNGGARKEIQSKNTPAGSQEHTSETEAAYITDRHSLAPYLLNGPSLSLSSNNAVSAGVRGGEGSVPSTNQHSPAGPSTFDAQESLGKLATYHQADDSMAFKSSSNTASRRNSNGQYLNEHGRILAEHIQSLQVRNPTMQDHHHSMKRENWMQLEGAVAQEGQTVLSLLETATGNVSRKRDCSEYNRQISPATNLNAVDYHQHQQQHHHYLEEAHTSAEARHHPLDFLQQQQHHPHHGGLHLNSASPTEMDHEASDAALSLHCMQISQHGTTHEAIGDGKETDDDDEDFIMITHPKSKPPTDDQTSTLEETVMSVQEEGRSAQGEGLRTDSGLNVQDADDGSPLQGFVNKMKLKRKGVLKQILEEPGDDTCVAPPSTLDGITKCTIGEKESQLVYLLINILWRPLAFFVHISPNPDVFLINWVCLSIYICRLPVQTIWIPAVKSVNCKRPKETNFELA